MNLCYNKTMKSQVKTIGAGGQIYLGKEFAGQHVLVTQTAIGVWQIKTADVIPHSQKFWYQPEVEKRMKKALAEVAQTPARVTTDEELENLYQRVLNRP